MIPQRQFVKHYASARRRFLRPSIQRFLQSQCSKLLGPPLVERWAERLAEPVERQLPPKSISGLARCSGESFSLSWFRYETEPQGRTAKTCQERCRLTPFAPSPSQP